MILDARGLVRRYGGVVPVGGVDLDVAQGEVVGVVGPNGAGKSTLFRLLAGLEAPDAGSVRLAGVDVTRWPLHRRARAGLAYLPQGPSVVPGLTAAQNLAVALDAVGAPRGEGVERLAAAGLSSVADRPAERLSGGERRRLEIARALALRPRVLLLDEPFAGVDPVAVAELVLWVRAIAADGVAVLLTDHAVAAALRTCDRVVLLDAGAVVFRGTPSEMVEDPLARERYLGVGFELAGGHPFTSPTAGPKMKSRPNWSR